MRTLELNVNSKSTMRDILFNIRLAGYGYIFIEYSGSGDSGCIETVLLIKKEHGEQDEDGTIVIRHTYIDDEKVCLPLDIQEKIEEYVYTTVLNKGSDWYNNDGGYGTVTICTEDGDYYDDRYIYEITSENETDTGNLLK